jgi:rod shape-determining protein MreC
MEPFFSRYRNALVLVVVLAAQLILLATQVNAPERERRNAPHEGHRLSLARYAVASSVAPFERLFMGMGHGLRGAWSNYIYLRNVRQQDHELKTELDRIRLEEAEMAADAAQGRRLQALLGFQESYIEHTVVAQVIGTGGADQTRVLLIDKGAADGLRTDMAVITPDGVVGKVREVFPHTSMVLEINDQTSGAGAILEVTRIRGIVRGNSAGQVQVIGLLPDERIHAGERVLTSGGDMVFPRGLAVGTITAIANDKLHPPYIALMLQPAADLERLEEVLVVTGTSATAVTPDAEQVVSAAAAAAAALPSVDAKPTPPGQVQAVRPLTPLHDDRYTPGMTPPAGQMQPGGGR